MSPDPMLSVVIPTLNAAASLEAAIASLPDGCDWDVTVSDGGSTDGTKALARRLGARVVEGPAGRGAQLARGAGAAAGDWLLFLHADSRLGPGAGAAIKSFIEDGRNQKRAGYFYLRFDDTGTWPRLLEGFVRLRCWILSLPYGDQGLLISRDLYDELGGFSSLPLMEDVDLVRRIGRRTGRRGLVALRGEVITSPARYKRDGYPRRIIRNASCLALYFLGVSPERIKRRYEG